MMRAHTKLDREVQLVLTKSHIDAPTARYIARKHLVEREARSQRSEQERIEKALERLKARGLLPPVEASPMAERIAKRYKRIGN